MAFYRVTHIDPRGTGRKSFCGAFLSAEEAFKCNTKGAF
jgi:hypothetical protein